MRKLLLLLTFIPGFTFAQTEQEFVVEIEPITIASAPGVHSYSWGLTDDQKWVIMGGRIDGLHQRQPFASFLEQDNNKFVYVIDPQTEQVWSSDLSVLPASMFEQLQSTNQQFKQRDSILYITGGYGYSTTQGIQITYPNLTAVSLNELADAVMAGGNIIPYFRQINDINLKVTGGQLGYLDSTFYLVGGNLFDGQYNPMGPTFGPGFTQVYTNEIRTFKIQDDGVNLSVSNYAATFDSINLHRRDYNMSPQIFPNGDKGFTAFAGVFDYNDMPWLNTVDIVPGSYSSNSSFNEYLSQYHSAKLPIYDTVANIMHTLFFGGLSQFTVDTQGNLVEDTNVPFVKTISKITRYSNGTMQEVDLGYVEMPTLVGPGAEFIPVDQYYYDNEILDLNSVPTIKTLVGYIYGGIQSTAANIFFVNDGTQSFASNTIFKVYINKGGAGLEETAINGKNVFNLQVYPNPVVNDLTVEFFGVAYQDVYFTVIDEDGRTVITKTVKVKSLGKQQTEFEVSNLPSGTYFITVSNGVVADQQTFIKK